MSQLRRGKTHHIGLAQSVSGVCAGMQFNTKLTTVSVGGSLHVHASNNRNNTFCYNLVVVLQRILMEKYKILEKD